jgi:hypothetical protein
MTLDECRAHLGDRVAWRAGSRLALTGSITSAGTRPFVRYGKAKFSTASRPEELTLLEAS